MYTLGINAAFHDCAAALVCDGVVLAAAEEERFTRIKHGKRPLPFTAWQLPFHAIDYCLAQAGIKLCDVDHIAYSFDPALLGSHDGGRETEISLPLEPSLVAAPVRGTSPWDPLFLSYIVNAPRQLAAAAPLHIAARFRSAGLEEIMERWVFLDHHLCHEASAYLSCPARSSAVLTMDGRGEGVTSSFGWYQGGEYTRLKQVKMPSSLGLLYEEVTAYLGFLRASDEYKVMALASYGRPSMREAFREIVQLDSDGGFVVQPARLVERFGPARQRGEELLPRHMDLACSLQQTLEETVLHMARWLHGKTGERSLCMAGGVALNCVMNSRIAREGPFEDVWVQAAAGDAGTALGAALYADDAYSHNSHEQQEVQAGQAVQDAQQALEKPVMPAAQDTRHQPETKGRQKRWTMTRADLGPSFSDQAIEQVLQHAGISYRHMSDIAAAAAGLLAGGSILGWFQGRMEFGPRALGHRSILASPVNADMQERLNRLKEREDFRPVAPAVLAECAHEWFDTAGRAGMVSPFMLFVYKVLPERMEQIPAVCHVDGTARIQTVSGEQNRLFHDLLQAFMRLTGVPVLVNTSFNTRGRPMVCTPQDALEAFFTSPLDALAIGSFLVEKQA